MHEFAISFVFNVFSQREGDILKPSGYIWIEAIMTDHISRKLEFGRKLLLAVMGIAAIGLVNAPAAKAQSQVVDAPRPSFDVASIKPSNSADRRPRVNFEPGGRFTAANVTVKTLIRQAYGIKDFQISGGPGWMGSDLFDITAKPDSPAKFDQIMVMLQSLLAERFQLVIRRETKEMAEYALVVAKNGPKFKDANESDPNVVDLGGRGNPTGARPSVTVIRRGRLIAQGANMTGLASSLANFLGRPVMDKTALRGKYDLKLEWAPDENQTAMFQAMGVPEGFGAPPPDWPGPSLFTALEEQLGLRLDSQKGPVEMFVIDRVERPSEN